MAIFIDIMIKDRHWSREQAAQLVGVCPVDIFTLQGGRLQIEPDEVDECTLCELCLELAPAGSVKIVKRYSGEVLVK